LEYDAQPGVAGGRAGTQTRRMVFEQRYGWGRAYRNGAIVCARVHLTIGRDGGELREIEFGLREDRS
jgi:hypothetical protein